MVVGVDPKALSPELPVSENGVTVQEKDADVTLHILERYGDDFGPLSPKKEKKLRGKLYWHVMGLLSAINLLLFVCAPNEYRGFDFPDFPRSTNQL